MPGDVANHVDRLEILPLAAAETAELLERASHLFGGDVAVEQSVDPECPTATYVVFHALLDEPRPTTDEIIDRELCWHREAARIAPDAKGIVRLLVE